MDTTVFDIWPPFQIVHSQASERLAWDANKELLVGIFTSVRYFVSVFPFGFHHTFNTTLTKVVPITAQPLFAKAFKLLVDENPATETA